MNTSNNTNNKREISQISPCDTPQSTDSPSKVSTPSDQGNELCPKKNNVDNPSKVSIPSDQGNELCPKKDNVDSNVENKKKSKLKHEMKIPPCPSCEKPFVMEIQNMRSPVMSMNCEHTICFSCVQHFVEKNKTRQKRNYITVCNCPIESCGAKRSFNCNTCNFNAVLIEFYHKNNSTCNEHDIKL